MVKSRNPRITFSVTDDCGHERVLDIIDDWREKGYNVSFKICELIVADDEKDTTPK